MLCDSVAWSKTAGYGQRTEGAAFRMAGNYGVARAQGRFSLRDAEGRLGLHRQSSFHPSPSSSPLLEEERRETAHQTGAEAQYPVAGQAEKPFRLCFSLVTLTPLLY